MDKVLLAEDDLDQLKLITTKLKQYSDQFEVIQVTDGKEAIDVLKEEQVSLVVTDILRFFQKPFDIDDFAHAIISALERKENLEDVKGISLLSILDLIQMEETTCMFEVETPAGPAGVMYFEDGILYDAKCGDLTGEAAALELISGEFAKYRFKFSPEIEVPRRIKTDLHDLIRNVIGSVKEC